MDYAIFAKFLIGIWHFTGEHLCLLCGPPHPHTPQPLGVRDSIMRIYVICARKKAGKSFLSSVIFLETISSALEGSVSVLISTA